MTKANKTDRKVVRTSTYHIEQLHYEDGTMCLNRTCDGFTPLELIGMLELTTREVIDQIHGKYKPDIITRKVISYEQ